MASRSSSAAIRWASASCLALSWRSSALWHRFRRRPAIADAPNLHRPLRRRNWRPVGHVFAFGGLVGAHVWVKRLFWFKERTSMTSGANHFLPPNPHGRHLWETDWFPRNTLFTAHLPLLGRHWFQAHWRVGSWHEFLLPLQLVLQASHGQSNPGRCRAQFGQHVRWMTGSVVMFENQVVRFERILVQVLRWPCKVRAIAGIACHHEEDHLMLKSLNHWKTRSSSAKCS